MPKPAQQTVAGETWSSMVSSGKYPADLVKDGVDEAAKLLFLTRRWTPFTYMLHKNFKRSQQTIKDRVYRAREIDELERTYPVAKGNQAGDYNTIALWDNHAAQLQENDILFVKGLYAEATGDFNTTLGQVEPSQGGTLGSNVGPDLNINTGLNVTSIQWSRTKGPNANGVYLADLEQINVRSVGAPGSSGVGLTTVTIDRFYSGPGAHDLGGRKVSDAIIHASIIADYASGTGDMNGVIKTNDIVIKATNSFLEGTGYGKGVYKNPIEDVNYTQLYKYAVEKTKESDTVQTWIKERPFDINKWITNRRFQRDREWSNLLGRKTQVEDATGRKKYITGGVREFIPKDEDHYIIYPNQSLTWNNLLDLSRPLLNLNNTGKMTAITGLNTMIALQQAFWNEHLWYNKEESKKFDMPVHSLRLQGVTLDLVVSQILDEAGFGNEMMCLDMGNSDSFEPVTTKGWDMRVEKDIGPKDVNIYKEGIQGMFGLRRRRRNHHAIIDFSNVIPA